MSETPSTHTVAVVTGAARGVGRGIAAPVDHADGYGFTGIEPAG